jgi:hypothetical protein
MDHVESRFYSTQSPKGLLRIEFLGNSPPIKSGGWFSGFFLEFS